MTLRHLPTILCGFGHGPDAGYEVLRFIEDLRRDATGFWDEAVTASEPAARQLCELLDYRARTGQPLSLIAFSLGTRVLLGGLARLRPHARGVVRRAIFAGGALHWAALEKLPRLLRQNGCLVNVYSNEDAVLKSLYPLVKTSVPLVVRRAP